MNITDAIDIMESISGVTDESTPVGDAWNVILRYIHNPTPPPEPLRPIPVSERLPEAEDCLGRPTESYDAGWCWVYVYESWSFSPVVFPMPHSAQPRVLLNRGTTHWLPANAIPFPEVTQ